MLEQILSEQRRCADWLLEHGPDHPEAHLARLGLGDWVAEEVLLYDYLDMTKTTYAGFLERKRKCFNDSGFSPKSINRKLKDFQRHIVDWSIRGGRRAIFSDCGTGKTFMQLEWANAITQHTGDPVLILAPLAVSRQTQREGERWGIPVNIARRQDQISPGVNITNYEMLHAFDQRVFSGVVLDESSILKSYSGRIRNQIIDSFSATPYRLACTATPSPNDFMELGNHAEFLGAMTRTAMLATFFNHDGGETSKWKLKGHAVKPFWEWVASWAVMLRRPSDLGFNDDGYELPALRRHYHIVNTEAQQGFLFPVDALDLSERRQSRRESLDERISRCADMVNGSTDQWLIWGDLNAETEAAAGAIPDAVEVAGKHHQDFKEEHMLGFALGRPRVLVSKPKIAGWGMNWQNCHNVVFMGLSDSYESRYQAVRRCWRFGQDHDVDEHIFVSDRDGAVIRNQERKQAQAEQMAESMIEAMKEHHDN